MPTYEKTSNPNIIKKTETVESEILLDKLREQIADLESQIASMPKVKTKPDQETLDYWNTFIMPAQDIQAELDSKKSMLSQLEAL